MPVLLFAAAAAGFLGGMIVRGPAGEERTARHERQPAPVLAAQGREDSRRERGALGQALASLPLPEPLRGSCRIDGTVRTVDGKGVRGALVRAVLEQEQGCGEGDAQPPTLEEEVRALVRSRLERQANTHEVMSDAAGRFALTALPYGEYALSGHLAGYRLSAGDEEVVTLRPGDPVAFIAEAVRDVAVLVVLPDGAPAGQCLVTATGESDEECREAPCRAGRATLRLPAGVYLVTAHEQPLLSDPVRVVVAPEGPAPEATLQLRPSAGLGGRVILAQGKLLDQVFVHALRLGAGEEPDPDRLVGEGVIAATDTEGGTYQFDEEEVPQGRYLVGVGMGSGGSLLAWRVVDVSPNTRCDFDIPWPPAKGFVTLRVAGPSGEAVNDIQVRTGAVSEGWFASFSEDAAIRIGEGVFLVAHAPTGANERNLVEAVSGEFGLKRAYYDPDRDRTVNIRFGEPARLTLHLRGLAGSACEGLLGAALVAPGLGEEDIWQLGPGDRGFDREGTIPLGPVESGSCRLVLYVWMHNHDYEIARHDVDLRPGTQELTIPLPTLHPLAVRAPNLRAGTSLVLERGGGSWMSVTRRVREEGTATFALLPAGRYTLRQEDVYGAAMEVTVPHAGAVAFEPRALAFNAIHVSIADREGLLARAGFLDNDLIVGINGTEFSGQGQMQLLAVKAAATPGTATLTVERAGRRLQIKLDLQAVLAAGESAGGGFEAVTR